MCLSKPGGTWPQAGRKGRPREEEDQICTKNLPWGETWVTKPTPGIPGAVSPKLAVFRSRNFGINEGSRTHSLPSLIKCCLIRSRSEARPSQATGPIRKTFKINPLCAEKPSQNKKPYLASDKPQDPQSTPTSRPRTVLQGNELCQPLSLYSW